MLCIFFSLAALAQPTEAPRDLELLVSVDESSGSIHIVSGVRNMTERAWVGCVWVGVEGWITPSEKARKTMAALESSDPSKAIEIREDEGSRRRWRGPGLIKWDPKKADCQCLATYIGAGGSVSDTTIVRYDTNVMEMFPGTFEGVVRLIECDKGFDPPTQQVIAIDSVSVELP
jgi:hypothetical protein